MRQYLPGHWQCGWGRPAARRAQENFFQAAAEHLLPTGAMLLLLEAQAATCTLVDPATGRQLLVDEAVRAGLESAQNSTGSSRWQSRQ